MIAIATRTASRLYKAGYSSIIPVIPPGAELSEKSSVKPEMRGKVPGKRGQNGWYGFSGWQDSECGAPEVASRWDDWGANIGLIADRFPGVDIDVDDAQLAAVCQKFALKHLGQAPCRLSRGSRRLLVYRTDTVHPIPKIVLVIEYKGEEHKVEVLGKGNQYLVSGTHPSGAEYRWAKSALWDLDPDDLTEVFESDVYTYLEKLSSALAKKGIRSWIKGQGAHDDEDTPAQEGLKAPSLEALEELVGRIENRSATFPDRDSYIAFGTAVKAAGGSEALYIFQKWASRWDGGVNDPAIVASDWERMRPPFRIGWEWLRRKAGDDARDEFEVDPDAVEPSEPASPRLRSLQGLNETYAVTQVGADVLILQEQVDGEIAFLKQHAFRLKLQNQSVPSEASAGRTQLLSTAWLNWSGRREYDRVAFKPGAEDTTGGEFNLWRGWGVRPSEDGSCDRFLAHLRDVVCSGDEEQFEYLLDFFAHIFQFPQEKPGTVIALRGGQGAGKSIVGATLKVLLGPHQVVADRARHVTGDFNAHLGTCLVLQAEEAFWGGDKKAEAALKHLVTGEYLRIERKGIDSVEMRNFTRLLITSNEEWVWPAALDDRRLVIFDVSNSRVGDSAYFRSLVEEMKEGGYERLLHMLLTRRIDRSRLETPPRTAALESQVAESMQPHEAWYLDLLEKGEIEGTLEDDGTVLVPFSRLYEGYYSSVSRGAFIKNDKAFGLWLRKRARPTKEGRLTVSDGLEEVKTTLYRLPPLDELREEYSAIGRGAPQEWEKPNSWVAPSSHDEDDLEVRA